MHTRPSRNNLVIAKNGEYPVQITYKNNLVYVFNPQMLPGSSFCENERNYQTRIHVSVIITYITTAV